ncbi:hypothetical protein C4D60_Mb05t05810 [Musa balbisiana]|uniref:Uncharacterized protein n=1 Tax=Musa balbisiana TaxID=52838 RepID=A0A4S8JU06_MUSBA|nr:hypothetical protein C4D60_Mb05t05810 [Musa balbisiana]
MTYSTFLKLVFATAVWCIAYAVVAVLMPLPMPSPRFAFSDGSVSRIPRVALLLVPRAMTAVTSFSYAVQRRGD